MMVVLKHRDATKHLNTQTLSRIPNCLVAPWVAGSTCVTRECILFQSFQEPGRESAPATDGRSEVVSNRTTSMHPNVARVRGVGCDGVLAVEVTCCR